MSVVFVEFSVCVFRLTLCYSAVERAAAPCEGPQAKSFGRFHNSPGRYS